MPLPETLGDPITAARSMISRAQPFDLNLQTGNAKAMLANARAFVIEDASIGSAFDEVGQRIDALRKAKALEDARRSVLQAIDSLEHSLMHARPNAYAKALGADWFLGRVSHE